MPAMIRAESTPQSSALRILALGSSTLWCGTALLLRDRDRTRVPASNERVGNDHSRRLLPMARELLDAEGLAWADLDAIAFDAGPGSFTGLRIGCGVAQGIAFALDLPVVAVSSLEALAWGAGAPRVLAALDARMGEVYFAEFDCGRAVPVRVGSIQVLPAELAQRALEERLADPGAAGATVARGDAFERYPRMAEAMSARGASVDARAYPGAEAIAQIAACRFDEGEALPAERASPLYVRDKVALNVDEQRRAREAREARASGAA
jgi:tRNA threonylcarbamoyladenosine biosynthesis protein TsaB